MTNIIVFGAGGRAGRRTVTEAVRRGHRVTAVVRDPGNHKNLGGDNGSVARGDATDAESVATVSNGHEVAVVAVYRADIEPAEFYVDAAHALLDGLARAGVSRLLVVGIGTTLENANGVRVMDGPDFPAGFLPFSQARAAELDVFRAATTGIDWLIVAPPPITLVDEPGTGDYSYAELAVALVDEIETPNHHRTSVGVGWTP